MTYSELTSLFIAKLLKKALSIGVRVNNRKSNIQAYAAEQLTGLIPIYDDLFQEGRTTDILTIKKDLSSLTKAFDVPLKYNKELLSNINGSSVFAGYFDTQYQGVYTGRDIYRLKSTILSAKYADLPEKELIKNIRSTIAISKRKAQLLARYEVSRIREATVQEYYKQPKIKKDYYKVFVSENDDRVRPSHKAYDGQIADENGLFHGNLGSFAFPPIPGEYNCRCRTKLVKKSELDK